MSRRPISRRVFLAGSAAVAVGACSGKADSSSSTTTAAPAPSTTEPTTAPAPTEPPPTDAPSPTEVSTTDSAADLPPVYAGTSDPFTLGVASGDPDATSVVHWTRLLPPDGELPDEVTITLDVFADEGLATVVATQAIVVRADEAHTAHAITTELQPDTWYWYRFTAGGFTSPVGRSRTTPAEGADAERLVLATTSCQNYEDGYYTAWADVAAAGVDIVAFLGDYIYEGAANPIGTEGSVRTHATPEPITLDDYRARYALYKRDAHLQAAHATCPWVVVWDDHEVENNYAGIVSQDGLDLTERRVGAYRAWWEHTPTRLAAPSASNAEIYRAFTWGNLADLSFLDTRQYRDDQACGDITLSTEPACPETFEPERTMLGREQREWLLGRFGTTGTTWNVLAQQVIMGNFMLNDAVLNFDQWDGYPVERNAIFQHVADQAIENFVVLTGDIHFAGIGNLRTPDRARVIGTEFVATSISSSGNVDPGFTDLVRSIGDVVDAELAHRGWIRHEITPSSWVADYRMVDDALVETSSMSTYRTFTVTAGTPGITA